MKKYATLAVLALGFVSVSGAFVQTHAALAVSGVNDTVVTDTTKKTGLTVADTVVNDTAKQTKPAFAVADTVVTDTVKKA